MTRPTPTRSPNSALRSVVSSSISGAGPAAPWRRALRPGELLDPPVLRRMLAEAGWVLDRVDDADDRYLALSHRA